MIGSCAGRGKFARRVYGRGRRRYSEGLEEEPIGAENDDSGAQARETTPCKSIPRGTAVDSVKGSRCDQPTPGPVEDMPAAKATHAARPKGRGGPGPGVQARHF